MRVYLYKVMLENVLAFNLWSCQDSNEESMDMTADDDLEALTRETSETSTTSTLITPQHEQSSLSATRTFALPKVHRYDWSVVL